MEKDTDAREAKHSNQAGTGRDVDNGDSTKIGETDEPQGATSFRGRFLRFAGMTIIVGAALFTLVFWGAIGPGLFILLLATGFAGAAMHYKGRKLAPGKHGASILGGILAGSVGSAAFILIGMMVIAMMVDGCKAFFKV